MEAFGKLAKEGVAFEGLDGSKVRSRLAGEGALDIGGVYCLLPPCGIIEGLDFKTAISTCWAIIAESKEQWFA
jgi:hypothetical protein